MTVAEESTGVSKEYFAAVVDRYEAIGKAQHRYMYLLLIMVCFLLLVDRGASMEVLDCNDVLRLEFIGVDVPRSAILAIGPFATSILLLGFLGTFNAATTALKALEASAPVGLLHEAYDRVPNLIDFAVYTKRNDSLFVRLLAASSYPFFATFIMASIVYLQFRLLARDTLRWHWAVVVLTSAVLIPTTGRTVGLWKSKLVRAWQGNQQGRQGSWTYYWDLDRDHLLGNEASWVDWLRIRFERHVLSGSKEMLGKMKRREGGWVLLFSHSVFGAIEGLSSFAYSTGNDGDKFKQFCCDYLLPKPCPWPGLVDAMYRNFRCGLAHGFGIEKGGLTFRKDDSRVNPVMVDGDSFWIDPAWLLERLERGAKEFFEKASHRGNDQERSLHRRFAVLLERTSKHPPINRI